MKYIGIVWNCSYSNYKKIAKVIKKYGHITESFDMKFTNEEFDSFITELYNYPLDEKWKSDLKINDLKIYDEKVIRIFNITIDSKKMMLNNKGKLTDIKAQKMKNEIRENFKTIEVNNIKKEIYLENSFHLTDDEEEFAYQNKVINKYLKKNYVEDYESAKYYDVLPRFSKEFYKCLDEKFDINNKKIADVGCGTGRITIDLLNMNNTVYAIEPDENMRAICKEKCNKFDRRFIPIDGIDSNMNIPNQSVDYIIVSQSYHKFNPSLFKEECKRVLKPNGRILIIWYRIDYGNPIYSKLLENVKACYDEYKTRYGQISESEGSKIEETENIKSVIELFKNNYELIETMSIAKLSKKDFIDLNLSMAIFPIPHSLNTVTEIIKSDKFNNKEYVKTLEKIFKENAKNNKIELPFRVQIISNKGEL